MFECNICGQSFKEYEDEDGDLEIQICPFCALDEQVQREMDRDMG